MVLAFDRTEFPSVLQTEASGKPEKRTVSEAVCSARPPEMDSSDHSLRVRVKAWEYNTSNVPVLRSPSRSPELRA